MESLSSPESEKVILVVEDDELSGRLLRSILVKGGYKVEFCDQGSVAIERLKDPHFHVDLIMTDIMMPLMGGFEFIAEFQKLGISKNFMVITSLKDKDTIDKAKQLGAYDYITKPYKSSGVLARVNEFFLNQDKTKDIITAKI